MTLERERHLQEMGEVLTREFPGFSLDPDGVVGGAYGKFVPVENQAPLDSLVQAMRMAGVETSGFKFQQYQVIVGNPYHGGKVDLRFPDQLVIKNWKYQGLHQLDLVLRSPWVCAEEIRTGLVRG